MAFLNSNATFWIVLGQESFRRLQLIPSFGPVLRRHRTGINGKFPTLRTFTDAAPDPQNNRHLFFSGPSPSTPAVNRKSPCGENRALVTPVICA
jgi:hypothetical protein